MVAILWCLWVHAAVHPSAKLRRHAWLLSQYDMVNTATQSFHVASFCTGWRMKWNNFSTNREAPKLWGISIRILTRFVAMRLNRNVDSAVLFSISEAKCGGMERSTRSQRSSTVSSMYVWKTCLWMNAFGRLRGHKRNNASVRFLYLNPRCSRIYKFDISRKVRKMQYAWSKKFFAYLLRSRSVSISWNSDCLETAYSNQFAHMSSDAKLREEVIQS